MIFSHFHATMVQKNADGPTAPTLFDIRSGLSLTEMSSGSIPVFTGSTNVSIGHLCFHKEKLSAMHLWLLPTG